MGKIEIRATDVRLHYATISGLLRSLHENERMLNGRTALWDDIEAGYMRHIIAMQDECEGLCLVAYDGDIPAGFIFGYIEVEDDSRYEEYSGRILYVSDGFIVAEYRRMGIYRMLSRQVEQHFIALGVKRITRFTLVANEGMRRFLAQEGYNPVRILYEKWL